MEDNIEAEQDVNQKLSERLVQASTPDHATRPRMTVHAGSKIQFGGFYDGLRRFSYQPPTVVIQPPTPRTSKVVMVVTMMGSVNFDRRNSFGIPAH